MSRKFNGRIEWQLNPKFFQMLTKKFGEPNVVICLKINGQLVRDTYAVTIDACCLNWKSWNMIYVFAHFSLVIKAVYGDDESWIILPFGLMAP